MLEGETSPIQIGFWELQGGRHPVRIRCETFRFTEGSLKGSIVGFISGTTLMLTLICAVASTPFGNESYNHFEIDHSMTAVYGGERCVTQARLTIKASDLLNTAAAEFNFKAQGLSNAEQQRSVCLVQLALDFDGHSPGPIDGLFRTQSGLALEAFQQKHNLKHKDVTDAELQRELAKAFHEGLRGMAR
jgi:hypothetical protein